MWASQEQPDKNIYSTKPAWRKGTRWMWKKAIKSVQSSKVTVWFMDVASGSGRSPCKWAMICWCAAVLWYASCARNWILVGMLLFSWVDTHTMIRAGYNKQLCMITLRYWYRIPRQPFGRSLVGITGPTILEPRQDFWLGFERWRLSQISWLTLGKTSPKSPPVDAGPNYSSFPAQSWCWLLSTDLNCVNGEPLWVLRELLVACDALIRDAWRQQWPW